MPQVLIVGASGRFGSAAAQTFAAAGWRVRSLSLRMADARDPLPALQADGPIDVLVYAANPLYTRWDQELLPLARRAMDLAQRLGALFMLPGNVYNFGASMPPLLRPDTPEHPSTRKGEQRRQLEAELRDRAESHHLRSVVIRAGDFYGHGTGSWLDLAIAKKLAQGRLVYPGPWDVPHAWAYLPDLARSFVAVAGRLLEAPAPGAAATPRHLRLHFAGHTLTGAQLLDGLGDAARVLGLQGPGDTIRRSRMRWAPVRAAGLFVPMLRELSRMAYLWHVPHALDDQALQALADPLPATPADLALQRALMALHPASESASAAQPSLG
jgi:nucleoside-diphosphate-sugar epimerase